MFATLPAESDLFAYIFQFCHYLKFMLVVGVKDIIQYWAVFSSKLQPKEILVQEERRENAVMMQIENIRHNFLQRRDV